MKNTTTEKQMRQRKFLLAMPVLLSPFLCLLFWVLDGGKPAVAQTTSLTKPGLNISLPDAKVNDDKLDKMNYYNRLTSDSVKKELQARKDPYFSFPGNDSTDDEVAATERTSAKNRINPYEPKNIRSYSDPNERKIYAKLNQLNTALNEPEPAVTKKAVMPETVTGTNSHSEDIDRLEQLLQSNGRDSSDDPELTQLNGMLEKILDIQNPDRLRDKIQKESEANRGRVFPVEQNQQVVPVTLLTAPVSDTGRRKAVKPATNCFYSLSEPATVDEGIGAIPAVVHEDQTIVTGSTVQMRLTEDVYINGLLVPKDNFVYGIAGITGERMTIKITSIRNENNLFPVSLSVYDMDGLEGIRIPGAISRDVAKQSAGSAVSGLGAMSMDPSIGMQVAGAGVEAAKGLLTKKLKLVRATVKAGYTVLLRDQKQKQ